MQMTPEECIEWLEGRSPPHVMDAATAHLRRLGQIDRERTDLAMRLAGCEGDNAALERENFELREQLRLLRLATGSRADRAALLREAQEAHGQWEDVDRLCREALEGTDG
jgi:hypothetical protein